MKYAEHSGPQSGQCVAPDTAAMTTGGAEAGSGGESGAASTTSTSASDPTLDSMSDEPVGTTSVVTETTGGPGGPVEFTDDELAGEFGEGTFSRVEYTEGRMRLSANDTGGSFVSRVFDAGAPVQWQTLSWRPDGPYSKPLPDERQAETGYVDGVDMAGNILLMHFDEPGTLGSGTVFLDRSGRGNNGTILSEGGASSQGVAGVFGLALDDHADTYVSIPPACPTSPSAPSPSRGQCGSATATIAKPTTCSWGSKTSLGAPMVRRTCGWDARRARGRRAPAR